MIDSAQIAQIEAVERDAWLDIYAAAPPPIRSALGIVQRRVDDGALLICPAIDHLQFNRLGYLGVTAPARAEAVDPALADFDAAGVKNWIVHVAQGADMLNAAIAGGGTLLTTETSIPHGGEPAPSYANIQRAGFAVAYPRPNLRRA
jgi:hypothetical protein